HAVDLSAAALREQSHRGLELIQRADDETATVKVDQRSTIGTPRRRRVIDPNRDSPVRAAKAEVLNLADLGHHLVDKGNVRPPLDVHRLMSAKNRPGLQPLGDL